MEYSGCTKGGFVNPTVALLKSAVALIKLAQDTPLTPLASGMQISKRSPVTIALIKLCPSRPRQNYTDLQATVCAKETDMNLY